MKSLGTTRAILCSAGALLAVTCTHAAPIEFDTADAHVVIVRPVDRWSADKGTSESTLALIRDRKDAFTVADAEGKVHYGNRVSLFGFGASAKNPIIAGVESALNALNATPSRMAIDFTNVRNPVTVKPEDMAELLEAQRALFKAMVLYYGNPATLPERVRDRKIVGGIAAAGVTLLTMGTLGAATGAQVALGSGITGETARIVRRFGPAAAPIPLPKLDFSGYRAVEVRRVVTGDEDRVGQIIIAYKADKTPEAEAEAMTRAIVKTLAIGTPIEQIEAARAEDLAMRQSIWDACVAEGKCPKDN